MVSSIMGHVFFLQKPWLQGCCSPRVSPATLQSHLYMVSSTWKAIEAGAWYPGVNRAQGQAAGSTMATGMELNCNGFGLGSFGLGGFKSHKTWPTKSSEGGTHCNVDLDGLSLLEAQVQSGAFVWVLGLFCKLTLLFHPPGEDQEESGEAGAAAALHSSTMTSV